MKKTKTARIDELKKELETIQERRKGAAPEELVKLDHEKEEVEKVMAALEATQNAPKQTPATSDPVEDMIKGINKYAEEKARKVAEITKGKEERNARLQEIRTATEDAKRRGDVMEMTRLHKETEDLEAANRYAEQMIEAAKAEKTYPAGAIWSEWVRLCEDKRAEYEAEVKDLEALAEGYRAALNRLHSFYSRMMKARARFASAAAEDGEHLQFSMVLNKDVDTSATMKRLQITDTYKATVAMMYKAGYIL